MKNQRAMHPLRLDPSAPCFVHIDVHARFDPEVGRWVAGSQKLNVYSSGDDPKKALDRAQEAIILFLNETEELGTIWEVLKEAGIQPQATSAPTPEPMLARLKDAFHSGFSFPLAFQIPPCATAGQAD